jgi:hypothetical protein
MTKLLLDKKRADATVSPRNRATSTRARNRPERAPQRPAGREGAGETAVDPGRGLSGADRPSARESRRRSEALAHTLAAAPDLDELVAVINEHGRSAVSRAAAVRPDLMPTVNGEFAHIALSLADLD